MRKNTLITTIVLMVALLTSMAPVAAQTGNWIEVNGGRTDLTLAADYDCRWGAGAPALINLPGMCGRSATTRNVYMIYSHAAYCDDVMCHYDLAQGGVSAWAALPIGYQVKLSINGQVWQGRVIEVIRDAGSQGIDGNTEFKCPTAKCGTLTTCADLRPAYVVVRVAYRRIR